MPPLVQHGGYLTAINDLASYGEIKTATYTTYVDWIRGDLLKRGKTNHHIQEVLSAILKHYGSQITWQSLVKSLTIDHHQTVSDYLQLLSRMDAVFIQYALLEDKLLGAPKKSRKVFFTDPFVLQAVQQWLTPNQQHNVDESFLVETVVINHFQRKYPTFYIKSKGEVNLAYIKDRRFWPIEIKWRNQIHPKDLKQINLYDNGVIWSKTQNLGKIHNTPVQPLLLELLKV